MAHAGRPLFGDAAFNTFFGVMRAKKQEYHIVPYKTILNVHPLLERILINGLGERNGAGAACGRHGVGGLWEQESSLQLGGQRQQLRFAGKGGETPDDLTVEDPARHEGR